MKASLFHLGPPKTATTWVYACLKDHPQIVTSATDRIHYFDMLHTYGDEWYHQQFTSREIAPEESIYFDPTYSYICSPRAAERLHAYNPDAKLMVCLREPVDRAFSHYWHQKKYFPDHFFAFDEIFKHYNHFSTWMEHGFTAQGLERFLKYFPREQLYVMDFDLLNAEPEKEYRKILTFSGLDTAHTPPNLYKKVNVAGSRKDTVSLTLSRIAKRIVGEETLTTSQNPVLRKLSGREEYKRGITPEMRAELERICEPETQALEKLLDIDLSHWRRMTGHQDRKVG